MEKLTKQELHNLAMNIVGKELEEKGYEFLAVKICTCKSGSIS